MGPLEAADARVVLAADTAMAAGVRIGRDVKGRRHVHGDGDGWWLSAWAATG
jgi:hypothetical protein